VPRAGLTPTTVIAEAAQLADEAGFEHLTLASLAARLGVRVPSLYKHVDGLDAVRRGVTLLAVRELGEALAGATAPTPGRNERGGLRALADAYRAYATAHPGRYAATVRAARRGDTEHAAATDAVLATVLAVLDDRGLGDEEGIDAARVLRAAVHGFVALEAAGGFGLPRDVERSWQRLLDVLDRGLEGRAPRSDRGLLREPAR
jgi:AcrR family transcriptional regulator